MEVHLCLAVGMTAKAANIGNQTAVPVVVQPKENRSGENANGQGAASRRGMSIADNAKISRAR